LKRVAAEVAGIVNGSLEYDPVRMRPRYRFLPGVPGASHGIEVASRMGFPPELLARAEALTPEGTRALERLLQEVQASGAAMREEAARLGAARAEAEAAEETHREATEASRRSLAQLRATLTRESEALLAQVRELWQSVRQEAKRATKSTTRSEALRADLAATESQLDRLQREAAEASGESHVLEAIPASKLKVGLQVRVSDLGDVVAEVAALPDETGRVALRRGAWNIQSHVSRLRPAEGTGGGGEPAAPRANVSFTPAEDQVAPEVDLRGMDVDEALRAVDGGLDRAVMAGLRELRIIHGLGKGVLKAAVERHLRGHPMVSGRRMGELYEGGRGVTVATLR
jgi:DNA mismatch repair protein MutS2